MRRATAVLVLAALALGGCNSSAEADVRRFCELIEQYNKGTGFEEPEVRSPENLTAALRDYLRLPEVEAILTELRDVAPEEVRDAVGTMTEVAGELAESGRSRFEDPDAVEANEQIVAYTGEHCAPEGDASPAEGDGAPAEGDGAPDEG